MEDAAARFERESEAAVDSLARDHAYPAPRWRQLVATYGSHAATARYVLDRRHVRNSSDFDQGFLILLSKGLLEHSMEAAVVRYADSGLFTDEQIGEAEHRLRWAGYQS